MTILTFCTTLSPSDGPRGLHIECEIEGEVRDDNGTSDPYFAIVRIWIDGEDWMLPEYEHTGWGWMAHQILKNAGKDDDFTERALAAERVSYRGKGPGDPDGRFIRPLELEAA